MMYVLERCPHFKGVLREGLTGVVSEVDLWYGIGTWRLRGALQSLVPVIPYTHTLSIIGDSPCYYSRSGIGCGHSWRYTDRYLEWRRNNWILKLIMNFEVFLIRR